MAATATADLERVKPPDSRKAGPSLLWLQVALVVGLIAALFWSVVPALVLDWWEDPGTSHGFLIPPLALYIAWTRRNLTFAQPQAPDGRGLLLILTACIVFLVGKLGAEFFLTRISLVILLAGLAWTFWGAGRLQT